MSFRVASQRCIRVVFDPLGKVGQLRFSRVESGFKPLVDLLVLWHALALGGQLGRIFRLGCHHRLLVFQPLIGGGIAHDQHQCRVQGVANQIHRCAVLTVLLHNSFKQLA